MRAFGTLSSAVAVAAFLASSVLADVDPIVIKGSKFFYKTNGTEFFIKGVAYQQQISSNGTTGGVGNDYNDPLANADACKRDIPYLQQLQTNTIRVYAVHPDQDHSQCMQMLQDAGIYVISDLSEPFTSINRDQPVWNDDLYTRYTSVIDDLQQYSNVLGFFAGNEVSNAANNTAASAFVKAAVRDMKAYIKQKNYRTIGVGYATNDDATIRENLANYFNCGPSEDSIDFWGYNIYSWCGDSSFQQSGYDVRTEEFANYSVPAFFAEYGCNTPRPRVFTEVQALYGKEMTPVWSGGIVYMYFEEANEFGLVSVTGDTVSKLPDFDNLSSQIAKITPSGVNMNAYKPTNTAARACPVEDASWGAASNLPPTPNEELCGCMVKALSCVTSPDVQESDYNDLFGTVCGLVDGVCGGIAANATTGTYGAYGMCNAKEQLDYAFNAYYQNQVSAGNGASACNFKGAATTQSATAPTGNCKALISQAGSGGTGTVTSAPSGTGGSSSGSSGSSGSSSGSGSSSSKSGTAGIMTTPNLDLGMLHMGAYVFCAMLAGMGMILL